LESGSDQPFDDLGDPKELPSLAFQVNPSVTAISDAETGRFIEVSDGFCETSGYERDQVIGKSAFELNLFAEPEKAQLVRDTVLRTGKARDVEVAIRTSSGRIRTGLLSIDLIDVRGTPYLLTIMHDVTDQMSVERDLRIKNRALESAVFGIGMTDLEGRVTYVNEAVLQLWGYDSKEEILGRALPEFFEGDSILQTMAALRAGEGISGEDVGKRKDGSVFPLQFSASVIMDEGGIPICTFGSFVDITARRKAEEERLALEGQIQKSQRLESLGVLAGGIAHDFNNILMGVMANAELALMDLAPESPVRKNLAEIVASARRAADLAKQMLAYSGRGSFVVETLDIRTLLEEMAHLLGASIAKGVALRYEFGQDVPPCEGDATQLRQIVMNLIINASEAIGDRGGVISINTGVMGCDRAYLSETYLDEALPEGLYTYFEVTDNGEGMDDHTQAKMFDPFFTTKFTGRGLGLAAVLGIVRGHRGAVKILSAVGKGTTIRILLPAYQGTIESVEERHTKRSMSVGGTALLIDDEPAVRGAAKMMLERLGFQVVTANNGREAVDIFKADPERFLFVILDLTMPEMSGERCLGYLQRIRKDVCVILTSGFSKEEVASRFAGKGLAGFIQKPFQLSALTEVLQACVKPRPGGTAS
jgi:PAS domain S-box-containing protein